MFDVGCDGLDQK